MDAALRDALVEWRDRTVKEWLGEEHFELHGAAPLMDDDVLQDIVKYASKRKLPTTESLRVNASWRRAEAFGEQVLQVVNSFIPQVRGAVGGNTALPLANRTGQFINLGVESVSFSNAKLIA